MISPTNTLPISFRWALNAYTMGPLRMKRKLYGKLMSLYIRNFGSWVAQAQTTPHLLRRTEAWQVLQMEPDFKIIQNLSAQAESAIVMLLSKFLQNLETSLSTCCLRLVSNIIPSHQKWISGTWNCKKRVICWAVRAEATCLALSPNHGGGCTAMYNTSPRTRINMYE